MAMAFPPLSRAFLDLFGPTATPTWKNQAADTELSLGDIEAFL